MWKVVWQYPAKNLMYLKNIETNETKLVRTK